MLILVKFVGQNCLTNDACIGYINKKGKYQEVYTDMKYIMNFKNLEGLIADVQGQFFSVDGREYLSPACISVANKKQVSLFVKKHKVKIKHR